MLIGIDASRAVVQTRTGTEGYSHSLIGALAAVAAGHRLRLYTPALPQSNPWPGVEIRHIPFPRLWTHLRLSREMLLHPPDVLFVPAHVLPLLHPRKSVVTVHDLGYVHFPAAHKAFARRYLAWSTAWNARQATHIIADSEATRRDLMRVYGTPGDKIAVVHLGRDETFAPERDPQRLAEIRRRYGIRDQYLLYVGTLQPRKNLLRLLEAFRQIAGSPEARGFQLVLVGQRGWQAREIEERAALPELRERVRITGYVPREELPALYSGALAFVFPSLYEGFGLPILEAGSCGAPVMCSNNSSLPEVAGDAALFVDPHDVDSIARGLMRLLAEPDLRRELSERGLQNVQRFSWDRCARETLAVLEQVAGGPTDG